MSGRRRPDEKAPVVQLRVTKRKRLTHAESIKRQQGIVRDYDVGHLTFAAIAKKLAMGEKEVREAYGRYIREIAPLMTAATPDEKAAEYLRSLEDVRQQLAKIGANADNDSARVGALRELVKVISKEIEVRQHLGLMPTNLAEIRGIAEQRWAGQQIAQLLAELNAPREAIERLEAILFGELES